MSVIRIVKDKNFITMGKYHLKEKDMSLKAIGLLSIMLSLPDDWNYSVSGLASIRKESRNTINDILNELEQYGYLERVSQRDDKGKIKGIEYIVYESPYLKNQDMENQDTDNRDTDNRAQLNTNIINNLNNKELNNKENIKERFIKPTLEEVEEYCKSRNNSVNAQHFIDFYESKGWLIGKNKMKDWKACVRTWEQKETKKEVMPAWAETQQQSEHTKEEIEEFEELLNSFHR